MITVKRLKTYLAMLPPDAKVNAYEGEAIGLAINLGKQSWWINAGPKDDEEFTEDLESPKILL